jgi:hypothetical protein
MRLDSMFEDNRLIPIPCKNEGFVNWYTVFIISWVDKDFFAISNTSSSATNPPPSICFLIWVANGELARISWRSKFPVEIGVHRKSRWIFSACVPFPDP